MPKISKVLLALGITITIFMIAVVSVDQDLKQKQSESFGSVEQASEYHSTTTSPTTTQVGFSVPRLIQSGNGALGSVIITGSGAGAVTLYDATTTNITLRDANQSTSTITIASLPPSPTVGVYTFDALYYRGLIYDATGGQSTTTITYR